MILLEEKPGSYRAEVSEDRNTLELVRQPGVTRKDMPETTAMLLEGVWIASVLEVNEEGEFHERWFRANKPA